MDGSSSPELAALPLVLVSTETSSSRRPHAGGQEALKLFGVGMAPRIYAAFCGSGADHVPRVAATDGTNPVPANPLFVRFDPVEELLIGVTDVISELVSGPLRHPALLSFGQGAATPYPLCQPFRHRWQLAPGHGAMAAAATFRVEGFAPDSHRSFR